MSTFKMVRCHGTFAITWFALVAAAPFASAQNRQQPNPGAQPVVDAPRPDNVTSLVGRLIYDGPPPQPAKIDFPLDDRTDHGEGRFTLWSDADLYRNAGLIDESLIVGEERGLANVFVWARSKNMPVAPHDDPLPPATIRFKEGRFDPHVLAFWRAAPLRWENKSAHGAQFNWDSPNQRTNVIVAAGESYQIKVSRPDAFPTRLMSNLHPWLIAYVLPLDHPYFSVTGRDGRFEIKNLPLGEWEFGLWHEKAGWLRTDRFPTGRFKVVIAAGKNDLPDLHVEPGRMTADELPK